MNGLQRCEARFDQQFDLTLITEAGFTPPGGNGPDTARSAAPISRAPLCITPDWRLVLPAICVSSR